MEIKEYIETHKKHNKHLTTVKIEHSIYQKIQELKGSVSMTQLVEALLRRFVDENKKAE